MGMFSILRVPGLVLAALLGIGLAAPGLLSAAFAAPPQAGKQQGFASPDAAVEALVKAVQADDIRAQLAILGPGADALVISGDPVADRAARRRFLDAYTASHTLTPAGNGRMSLTIGPNAWPVPIPLRQADNEWRFDAGSGAQQIVDRRIGRNELMTIRTLLAVVAAQKDYFDRLQRGSGSGAYAQRVLSTPGNQDGLYWDAAPGEAPSPLGPLIAQVESEGYPGATASKGQPTPYQGYFYHLLRAQGSNAPGGAKDYVRNGHMTDGFAFVAWPAGYETSGIVTFLVDQDGMVFQKDLGRDTAKIASGMTRFDPDITWTRVDLSD
jgi:hypothetical protein